MHPSNHTQIENVLCNDALAGLSNKYIINTRHAPASGTSTTHESPCKASATHLQWLNAGPLGPSASAEASIMAWPTGPTSACRSVVSGF